MAYFTRASATGRPLQIPVAAFTAILYAKLHGYSRHRAEEIIAANPEAASPLLWRLAAVGQSEGCETAEAFEAWIKAELSEQIMKSPSIP